MSRFAGQSYSTQDARDQNDKNAFLGDRFSRQEFSEHKDRNAHWKQEKEKEEVHIVESYRLLRQIRTYSCGQEFEVGILHCNVLQSA